MNKRIFFFLTPCMIACVGLLVMLIEGLVFMARSKGLSFKAVIIASSFLSLYLVSDYLIRRWFAGRVVAIWIIEILFIGLSAFLFWNYFPFKHFAPIN